MAYESAAGAEQRLEAVLGGETVCQWAKVYDDDACGGNGAGGGSGGSGASDACDGGAEPIQRKSKRHAHMQSNSCPSTGTCTHMQCWCGIHGCGDDGECEGAVPAHDPIHKQPGVCTDMHDPYMNRHMHTYVDVVTVRDVLQTTYA